LAGGRTVGRATGSMARGVRNAAGTRTGKFAMGAGGVGLASRYMSGRNSRSSGSNGITPRSSGGSTL